MLLVIILQALVGTVIFNATMGASHKVAFGNGLVANVANLVSVWSLRVQNAAAVIDTLARKLLLQQSQLTRRRIRFAAVNIERWDVRIEIDIIQRGQVAWIELFTLCLFLFLVLAALLLGLLAHVDRSKCFQKTYKKKGGHKGRVSMHICKHI